MFRKLNFKYFSAQIRRTTGWHCQQRSVRRWVVGDACVAVQGWRRQAIKCNDRKFECFSMLFYAWRLLAMPGYAMEVLFFLRRNHCECQKVFAENEVQFQVKRSALLILVAAEWKYLCCSNLRKVELKCFSKFLKNKETIPKNYSLLLYCCNIISCQWRR